MSTFKLEGAKILFTDPSGNITSLDPSLTIFPHPRDENLIVVANKVDNSVDDDLVIAWSDVTLPVAATRNELIEALSNLFLAASSSLEAEAFPNAIAVTSGVVDAATTGVKYLICALRADTADARAVLYSLGISEFSKRDGQVELILNPTISAPETLTYAAVGSSGFSFAKSAGNTITEGTGTVQRSIPVEGNSSNEYLTNMLLAGSGNIFAVVFTPRLTNSEVKVSFNLNTK